jgi:LPXTG-motif cell wall-anchored protein
VTGGGNPEAGLIGAAVAVALGAGLGLLARRRTTH